MGRNSPKIASAVELHVSPYTMSLPAGEFHVYKYHVSCIDPLQVASSQLETSTYIRVDVHNYTTTVLYFAVTLFHVCQDIQM